MSVHETGMECEEESCGENAVHAEDDVTCECMYDYLVMEEDTGNCVEVPIFLDSITFCDGEFIGTDSLYLNYFNVNRGSCDDPQF